MARLKCKCGTVLSNSIDPKIEYLLFSDDEWMKLLNMGKINDPAVEIEEPKVHLWKCLTCFRLYIFKAGVDAPIQVYKLDMDDR